LTSVRPSAPPKIFKCDAYRIRVWCYVYELLVSFAVTIRRYISNWRSFYGTMSHQNLAISFPCFGKRCCRIGDAKDHAWRTWALGTC
jgi:hypothetical protein